MTIELIGLDADDTLWHNEINFQKAHRRFLGLVAPFAGPMTADERLDAVVSRNLGIYGYGVKAFTLSMLEAAVELAEGDLPSAVVAELLQIGRALAGDRMELLEGVRPALEALRERAPLVLITKGDLFHQEAKLAASGLAELFTSLEVVSDKSAETYRRIFRRHGVAPERTMMAGNAMKSDVLPALEAGAYATLVPYPVIWAHEADDAPAGHPRYREVAALSELVAWIDEIGRSASKV